MNDIKIAAIAEQFKIAKFPGNKNFYQVSFSDKQKLDSFDAYLQWNILGGKNINVYLKYILDSKKPFLVAETPLIRINYLNNKMMYYTYGWLSYKRNKGIFNNKNSPSDRWKRIEKEFNIQIKDFYLEGDNILLILQKPEDSSIHDVVSECGSWISYVQFMIKKIREYSDRKIIIRPHPDRPKEQASLLTQIDTKKLNCVISGSGSEGIKINPAHRSKGIKWSPSMSRGLMNDMKQSRVVVSYNSNALTESVMFGKPSVAFSESACSWPVCNRIQNIENINTDIDIHQWLYDLCYCQWREDEIVSGAMWDHLKSKYYEAKNAVLQTA
jgi:hypothetical protein